MSIREIGTEFTVTKDHKYNDCYVGQKVIIIDYDYSYLPTQYLVIDANDDNFFCCWQSIMIGEE